MRGKDDSVYVPARRQAASGSGTEEEDDDDEDEINDGHETQVGRVAKGIKSTEKAQRQHENNERCDPKVTVQKPLWDGFVLVTCCLEEGQDDLGHELSRNDEI